MKNYHGLDKTGFVYRFLRSASEPLGVLFDHILRKA